MALLKTSIRFIRVRGRIIPIRLKDKVNRTMKVVKNLQKKNLKKREGFIGESEKFFKRHGRSAAGTVIEKDIISANTKNAKMNLLLMNLKKMRNK